MPRLHIRPRQLKADEAANLGRPTSDRLRVLDPMTERALPDGGQQVVQSSYWVRRLRCGDVEQVKSAPRARGTKRSGSEKE